LFVKDPAKQYKELIQEKAVPNITKVLGIGSLRNKYQRYEARRKLLQSYDLFICDENISLVLRRFLGKNFFNTKRYPIPIRLNSKLAENVARARDSTFISWGKGSCINVRIGKSNMTEKELCQNIIEGVNQIVSHVPGGWQNIKSLHIKTKNSVSLPFYNSVPIPSEEVTTGEEKTENNESK